MEEITGELKKWDCLQRRYPASAWICLWYAKELSKTNSAEYEQQKSRLLLSFYDRKRYYDLYTKSKEELPKESAIVEQTAIAESHKEITEKEPIIEVNQAPLIQEEEKVKEEVCELSPTQPTEVERIPQEDNADEIEEKAEVSPIVEEPIIEVIENQPITSENDREELIDNLIDKFSNDPPKIKFDPEIHDENYNYGKSSCIENPEIISETLAKIFAEQGYVGKAVKIYKKLALHNPEKSCYFADQIKKLKIEK
ncbi:MAG: hypothetical protein MJZ76_03100 [Bacteroidales bacterium]|nr:hypothetical protein [Bacteroidales bacterium]